MASFINETMNVKDESNSYWQLFALYDAEYIPQKDEVNYVMERGKYDLALILLSINFIWQGAA